MADSNSKGKQAAYPQAEQEQLPFSKVLNRNITTLVEIRQRDEKTKGLQDRIADSITRFTGSMLFVYLHLAWIGSWVIINLGVLGLTPFDPYPFGLLTMIGSLEAIFLSTFVLISQNRMAAVADKRAELDLQINLLSEHEITQTVRLLDAIASHLGVTLESDNLVSEAKQDVNPSKVVQAIEQFNRGNNPGKVTE